MDEKSGILSTGKKVNSATDDPTAYFLAKANDQRVSDLQTLKDAMARRLRPSTPPPMALTPLPI